MEKIIEYFALNPVHLAIALVLAFIVLFSFVKKLLKLSMVIIAIFIIYIAYLVYTGKEFDPNQLNEVGKKAKEIINAEGIVAVTSGVWKILKINK